MTEVGFDSEPLLRRSGKTFVVQEPMAYQPRRGDRIVVPAGFESDLDSRPKWLPGLIRLFMDSQIEAARAALLHDFLYRTGHLGKRRADALFREALVADGEARWVSWVWWAGVAFGGHWAWFQNRRAARRRVAARRAQIRRLP